MTSYKRLALLLSAVLLPSLPMFGQYAATTATGVHDGTTTTCKTTLCFVQISGTLQTISAASDGTSMEQTRERDSWEVVS
jgi:hypothetical protein